MLFLFVFSGTIATAAAHASIVPVSVPPGYGIGYSTPPAVSYSTPAYAGYSNPPYSGYSSAYIPPGGGVSASYSSEAVRSTPANHPNAHHTPPNGQSRTHNAASRATEAFAGVAALGLAGVLLL